MSGDSVLSERDEAVLEAIGGDADTAASNGAEPPHDTDDAGNTVEVPVDEWTSLLDRVAALENRVTELERDQDGPGVRDSMCTLAKYAKLVEDGEVDSLGVTDRRAVAIYRNWSDLSEKLPTGAYGVSTRRNSRKKNAPSQFKLDLENILGETLEWEQIYRAMQQVAELSGGESHRDDYDRLHIDGGIYEYHEKTTPDGQSTYKVLLEP